MEAGWRLENTYARLPDYFYQRTRPERVGAPEMAVFNRALAADLGLDADVLDSPAGAAIFAGNEIPPGSDPIAQAYAGHQFGGFTMLGDGRAILLGEQITPDGRRVDVQLKGSGRTAFSRRGDGRAALGPMLREYIISEAMHGLGIPTTRSLAVARTGESVFREERLPGAVLTRIAASHIRVGTFEYASGIGEPGAVRTLVDYTLARHDPERAGAENPALALLESVVERQASLIARWLHVGFVHGVMNTDNMALSGETIDYGPCAFLDAYDPAAVFSSIDHYGRYAYGNQPTIAQWNLARLAESLLSEIDSDSARAIERANEALSRFPDLFRQHWLRGLRAKIGLGSEEDADAALIEELLETMHQHGLDFTNTFRQLDPDSPLPHLEDWHVRWTERLRRQSGGISEVLALMQRTNPVVIPRNHRVEEALAAAVEHGDYAPLHALVAAVSDPFTPPNPIFYEAAPVGSEPYRTFCGT
ncbi:MAG: YdiU family protein [Terrimicrobiaceae bacterium]|nr:YdiU family protein [Terrimicrobiaceae bacterium]